MTPHFPTHPTELTAAWLTEVLRSQDVIKNGRVQSFTITPALTGETTGMLGEHARLRLKYNIAEVGAPTSLYAKFSLADPDTRAWANRGRFYECEVRFYQQATGQVELRTPRCYYSALDPESGHSVLLLEDLAPARSLKMADGCSPQQAERAVRAIAKFHATWWDSPKHPELDWLPMVPVKTFAENFPPKWESFLEKVGDRVPQSFLDVGHRYVDLGEEVDGRHLEYPLTFSHGDYQIENIFFATAEGGVPFAVIDWHLARHGRGPKDVVYLMVTSMRPADRKACEMDLLRKYHGILLANGVQDYSFDQCWLDYRLDTLYPFHLLISTIGLGISDEDRLEKYFATWTPRVDAALTDLNIAELLRDLYP